jgi:hypothetical protein
MEKNKFKNRLAILLILSHVIAIVQVIVLYFSIGFKISELTTTLSMLTPIFTVYTTLIIKNIIENKVKVTDTSQVEFTETYVFISFFIATGFTIYLFTINLLKAFNIGFSEFDNYKTLLGISETLFGLYLGQIIPDVYKSEKN